MANHSRETGHSKTHMSTQNGSKKGGFAKRASRVDRLPDKMVDNYGVSSTNDSDAGVA
jgi:hypothetical protein